jgi:hypothetical protein
MSPKNDDDDYLFIQVTGSPSDTRTVTFPPSKSRIVQLDEFIQRVVYVNLGDYFVIPIRTMDRLGEKFGYTVTYEVRRKGQLQPMATCTKPEDATAICTALYEQAEREKRDGSKQPG